MLARVMMCGIMEIVMRMLAAWMGGMVAARACVRRAPPVTLVLLVLIHGWSPVC
jgi:hypothetical protein